MSSSKFCPAFDAVVAAASLDAFESGYKACRRHLIAAALNATDIKAYLPGSEYRLAELRQSAVLATNLVLDRTIVIRQPNHDLGRSVGFNAAINDAAKLAADLKAPCVCPSHLLEVLINNRQPDEDGIDPSYWNWSGVKVEHPANCS